jgi:hypothetical protein
MAMIVAHEWYREHGKYKAAKPGKSQSLEYGDPSWIGWYFQFSVFELSANRCGFNRSTQQIGGIVQRVIRSLGFFWDARSRVWPQH